MATINYSIEQTIPSFQNSAFPVGGRRGFLLGWGARYDCDVLNNTGVSLSLSVTCWVNSGAPILQASIDGGAWADFAMPAVQTWSTLPVPGATTLAAGGHTIAIRHKPGSTPNVVAVDYSNALTATYTPPPPPSPPILPPSLFGQIYKIGAPPLSQCSAVEGQWERGASLAVWGGSARLMQTADSLLRIRANVAEVRVGVYANGAGIRLIADGVPATSPAKVTLPANSAFEWISMGIGLSGTHVYDIVAINGQVYISDIMLLGGTGIDATYRPRLDRGRLYGLGDSITAGNGVGIDSSRSWLYALGQASNRQVFNRGQSSNPLVSTFAAVGGQDRWGDLTQYGQYADDVMMIELGTNDANVATPDFAAIQDSATFLLRHLTGAQQWPSGFGKIVVLGLLPYTSGNVAMNRVATNAALAAAISTVNKPEIVFTDPATWNAPAFNPATMLADGVHPNDLGVACMVSNLTPLVPVFV